MTFCESFKKIMDRKKMRAVDVARNSGLSEAIISEYLSGKKEPRGKQSISLAMALNVTLDELWDTGLVSLDAASRYPRLSKNDQHFLSLYQSMDTHGKIVVEHLLESEWSRMQESMRETCSMDLFDLPVSAGTGVYLDGYGSEPIEIINTPEAAQANYCLRVSGNSMEPIYHDGDIVLVETAPDVEIGAIGVFIHDDQGYIKRLGKGTLISENKEYAPIKTNETTIVKGRVLGKAVLA